VVWSSMPSATTRLPMLCASWMVASTIAASTGSEVMRPTNERSILTSPTGSDLRCASEE
jgi:hypothetical protein